MIYLNKFYNFLLKTLAAFFTIAAVYWVGKRKERSDQEINYLRNANKTISRTLKAEQAASKLDDAAIDRVLSE